MIEVVDNFLEEFNLKSPDNTFLVGFSGGCDSLCLLDILNNLSKKYGFSLVALHLNHNWRGDESLQDELNCKKYCEINDISYISEILAKSALKTENSAREARYEFFLRCAQKYQNSKILTAHTRTDNAETVVYRIIKGTGINGLQGILPERMMDGVPLYRPLLSVSRNEIEGYCISNGLIANNDSSNADVSYKRNFIRHKIMPLFKEINFHAERSIVSLSKLAISQTKIVDEYINLLKKDIYIDGKILTEKFKNLSEDVMKKLIYEACLKETLDYDYKKIVHILEFIKSNFDSKAGSRYSLTKDLWLFVSSKYIYLITESSINDSETQISQEGEYEVLGTNFIFSIQKYEASDSELKFPPENAKFAYVNLEDLTGLTVRTRRAGDYIHPFGMTGTTKLKKYLNSKGVFQHDKNKLIFLCKGSEVLWVVGVGLSNKLKVVKKPTHVLRLLDED